MDAVLVFGATPDVFHSVFALLPCLYGGKNAFSFGLDGAPCETMHKMMPSLPRKGLCAQAKLVESPVVTGPYSRAVRLVPSLQEHPCELHHPADIERLGETLCCWKTV